jgi:hypothetical protein
MVPRENTRRKLHILLPDIYPVKINGPLLLTAALFLESLVKKRGLSCENKINAKGLDKTKWKRIVYPLFVLTESTLELCFYHLSFLVPMRRMGTRKPAGTSLMFITLTCIHGKKAYSLQPKLH